MATKLPRLNVVVEPRIYVVIKKLSEKAGVSMSLMARDLLNEALILHEDAHWVKAAQARERTLVGKKMLTHRQVWGS